MCNCNVGKVLRGFCGGYFGRDSYGDKIIEGEGRDWIVVRECGTPDMVTFQDENEKNLMIEEWMREAEQ